MKTRLLPDIDLARIAPLANDKKRKLLEQIRYGRPPFSYGPFRSCLYDIFNVQPEMFGPVAPTDWAIIEAQVQRKSRSGEELKANLAVAKGLYEFALEAKMRGRAQEFFPLSMGCGQKVSYWLPMILAHEGRPLVPFIDPRQSRGLGPEARRFVFSIMHERIRAADTDYAAVEFAIFKFTNMSATGRRPVIYTDANIPLFSIDQLEVMVSDTYSLWREICEEREASVRQQATGTYGPLL